MLSAIKSPINNSFIPYQTFQTIYLTAHIIFFVIHSTPVLLPHTSIATLPYALLSAPTSSWPDIWFCHIFRIPSLLHRITARPCILPSVGCWSIYSTARCSSSSSILVNNHHRRLRLWLLVAETNRQLTKPSTESHATRASTTMITFTSHCAVTLNGQRRRRRRTMEQMMRGHLAGNQQPFVYLPSSKSSNQKRQSETTTTVRRSFLE